MKHFIINTDTMQLVPVNKKAALGVCHDNAMSGGMFTLMGGSVFKHVAIGSYPDIYTTGTISPIAGSTLPSISGLKAYINFSPDWEEQTHLYEVDDLVYDAGTDTATFSWKMDRRATANPGEIRFSVCLRDASTGRELNTEMFVDKILEGLEADTSEDDEDAFKDARDIILGEIDAKGEEWLTQIGLDGDAVDASMSAIFG